MVQAQDSMCKIHMGRCSEEEYLLGHDKYVLNMCSNHHGELPRSFSDKDVYYEHPRMMGPQQYLRESSYHNIECTITTFLATFILRRLLNSVALTITTHRKPERVSNETGTQVKAQMINKCRIKMMQEEIYNVRDSHKRVIDIIEKKHCSNQNCTYNMFN